jgi:hypothetical protein
MAEALTFARNPPFAADTLLDGDMRLAVVGAEAAYQVVVGASPEVVAASLVELDASSAANTPTHPDLASLHAMGTVLRRQAKFDPSAKRVLPGVSPKEAGQLGIFVAASAVSKYLTDSRTSRAEVVDQHIHDTAQALIISQGGYEPDSRRQVFSAALDLSLDENMRGSLGRQLIRQLTDGLNNATPQHVAAEAVAYWASEPPKLVEQATDYTKERLRPPAVKAEGMPTEQLFNEAPEFVAAVMAGAELTGDIPEKEPLQLYQGGIRRAVAYISLVTAKTASGEWSSSIFA